VRSWPSWDLAAETPGFYTMGELNIESSYRKFL
jgi:hypothetical protein